MSIGPDWHSQRCSEIVGQVTWLLLFQPDLELFTLVVEIAVKRHPGFRLPFEEGVVELLVVNVDLAHLGPRLLPHLRLEALLVLLLLERLAHLHDASFLDEVGQVKGRFLNTSFSLRQGG